MIHNSSTSSLLKSINYNLSVLSPRILKKIDQQTLFNIIMELEEIDKYKNLERTDSNLCNVFTNYNFIPPSISDNSIFYSTLFSLPFPKFFQHLIENNFSKFSTEHSPYSKRSTGNEHSCILYNKSPEVVQYFFHSSSICDQFKKDCIIYFYANTPYHSKSDLINTLNLQTLFNEPPVFYETILANLEQNRTFLPSNFFQNFNHHQYSIQQKLTDIELLIQAAPTEIKDILLNDLQPFLSISKLNRELPTHLSHKSHKI